MLAFLFVKYVLNNLKNNSCKFVKFVVEKKSFVVDYHPKLFFTIT